MLWEINIRFVALHTFYLLTDWKILLVETLKKIWFVFLIVGLIRYITIRLQLGIDPSGNPTEQDPWDALVGRIKFLFADEVGSTK